MNRPPMISLPFLRIEKLSGQGHLLRAARHNRRTIQAELKPHGHIDPKRTSLNQTLCGESTPEDVNKEATKLMRAAGVTKLRKDAVTALEIVFSIPTSLDIDHEAYFAKCTAWAAEQFGGSCNILSADVHHDEAHPHLHVLILPLRNGRMVGSDMVGNRQLLASRHAQFYDQVARHFGLPKPSLRLTGAAKANAIALVLTTLYAKNDAALRSIGWQAIRSAIESDPLPWLALLGLQKQEQPKRLRSSTDIFISPGKGPKKEPNPVGFAFPRKARSLSCVGFAQDATAACTRAEAMTEHAGSGSERKEALATASHASASTVPLRTDVITASKHLEATEGQSVEEEATPAGRHAGCGRPCGTAREPMRTETDAVEPADKLRNPKVARGASLPLGDLHQERRASNQRTKLPTDCLQAPQKQQSPEHS